MDAPKSPGYRGAKDTIFYRKPSLNLGGVLCSIDRPWVMGILNVTPDSFYAPSRYRKEESLRQAIARMLEEGADIIDIGAASSRPGASPVEAKEEIARLKPVLDQLQREFPGARVSVDTYQSEVARAAVDSGAHMINDISGGTLDPHLFQTVAALNVPYVLMHMQGTPKTMQQEPQYDDVYKEVLRFFSRQMEILLDAGVNDLILDPGFGFGKTTEHNYRLLEKLKGFGLLERPVMVGVSRKRMINEVLGTSPQEALNGTTALHVMALERGAHILRVHDVRPAVEAVKIVTFTQNLA